jgi:hypothetical protein
MEQGILAGAAGGANEAQPEQQGSPEVDQAMDMVRAKLYDENIADGIAEALLSSDDVAAGVAQQAQMLLSVADEVSQGSVPDEDYMLFALELMSEVIEIAQAAGIEVRGRDIGVAMRTFITGVVESVGGDPSQLSAAMEQVNVDEMGEALDAVEE